MEDGKYRVIDDYVYVWSEHHGRWISLTYLAWLKDPSPDFIDDANVSFENGEYVTGV